MKKMQNKGYNGVQGH